MGDVGREEDTYGEYDKSLEFETHQRGSFL